MNKSLKNSITIKIGLTLSIILAMIFTFVVIDFRQAQINKIQNEMKGVITNVSNKINAHNKQVASLLKTMANYQKVGGFGNREESVKFLRKILEDNTKVYGAYFIYESNADGQDSKYQSSGKYHNSTGRFVGSWVRSKEGITISDPVENEVLAESQFYQNPKQTGKLTITEPYIYKGVMMTEATYPLQIEGKFRGIVGIDRSLKKFQKLLNNLKSYATAKFYLLSSNNQIIGTTAENNLLTKNLAELDKYKSIFKPLTKSKQVKVIKNEKLASFVAYAPIEIGGWNVIMTVKQNEVLAAVNQSTATMISLGGLGILILCGLLYWLISRSLDPLIEATDFAQEIAEENLDIAKMKVDSQNEVGKLKQALNTMHNRLKRRIDNLRRERNKIAQYFEVSKVLIFNINQEGKIVEVNQKSCEILGYRKEELLGSQWTDFVDESQEQKITKHLASTPANQVTSIDNFQSEIITKTGERRQILWNSNILKDAQGNIKRVLSSGKDITKYELLKEELEYNKLQMQFFANLSHELKTPLNLIFSSLQVLDLHHKNKLEPQTYKKLSDYTETIEQNSYRMLRLVNNLVDITKINSNSFNLNLKNSDIVEILRKITYSVENYIENKAKVLEFNSNIEEKIIACDPFSIERIMLNLLSNAIKFTESGDKISVNLVDKQDIILISVRDTGIGIPQKKQNTIFKQFRQVNKSFTRNHEGTGIGLAIVKLLVELHNGEITVNSKYGEFTEFNIKLPKKKLADSPDTQFNYKADATSEIDRIKVEFSDIYNL
ncbi:ATP-binding protein [Halanaerobaculum tunisiense]